MTFYRVFACKTPEQLSGQALVVKRFDRSDQGNSIHIEDFAQVFGLYPEDKYGKASYRNIAKVLWAEIGLGRSLQGALLSHPRSQSAHQYLDVAAAQ